MSFPGIVFWTDGMMGCYDQW